MNPKVSLNLLLYKPGKFLEPCFESLLAQTYPEIELLMVENGSGDDTAQRVKELMNGRQISWRLIENQKNLGFAGGHNQGIKESKGELVLLVNQDMILASDYVERLVSVFQSDPKIGSAQGKILRLKERGEKLEKTSILDSAGLLIFKNRRIIARGAGKNDGGQFDKQEEIFGVDGPLPMYRREALEAVKICLDGKCEYFDEDFFAYKEDVDLAWRMRLAGWKAIYEPGAQAWHARTAGDMATNNYFKIASERFKINKFSQYQSFKNQRLLQFKNEQWPLLLKHLFWFLPKEAASWGFILVFEHYTWKAIKDLFKQIPLALKKRRIIMSAAKVTAGEMSRWFK